jgi:thioredoxin reductase (NADPH)
VRLVKGVTPEKIEKLPSGKLLVTFGSVQEEFDTVLCAVGRYADAEGLQLNSINITVNPKSGKIDCQNEQTSTPNIYAIGDVVHGAPELTPVAIWAGRLLAKRLFGSRSQVNYSVLD